MLLSVCFPLFDTLHPVFTHPASYYQCLFVAYRIRARCGQVILVAGASTAPTLVGSRSYTLDDFTQEDK